MNAADTFELCWEKFIEALEIEVCKFIDNTKRKQQVIRHSWWLPWVEIDGIY